MANKITTVQCSDILNTNRFEPRLYLFQTVLKKCKNSMQFVTLDDIATSINRGLSPSTETYKNKIDGKYIFIRTADVKKFQINTESAVYLDDCTFKTLKSNRISKNDILISVVGNYLGSTAIIPSNIEQGAFNDNSARIRISVDYVSPYYISAFLNSTFGQQLIQSFVTRTGQKILSAGNVKKLFVPIINNSYMEDCYKTALNFGAKSNELIFNAQKLFYNRIGIDFKSIAKQNTFSVNKSDFAEADLWTPTFSNPLFVNTLKSIKEKWETINIGAIADLKKGDEVGSDEYISYIDKRKSDVPFVRTSDIVNYEIDQYPDFYIPVEIYEELDQGFKQGDVLFTKDGKVGMVGMLTDFDKSIISSGFAGLRLNKKAERYHVTPEYLFLVLSIKEIGHYAAKRRTVVASTIPHLREERLKEIEIPILDSFTINEITNLVKQAFKLKDDKKRLIAEVRETMDGYFEM